MSSSFPRLLWLATPAPEQKPAARADLHAGHCLKRDIDAEARRAGVDVDLSALLTGASRTFSGESIMALLQAFGGLEAAGVVCDGHGDQIQARE